MSKGLINTSTSEKMPNLQKNKKEKEKNHPHMMGPHMHCIHKSLANLFHGSWYTSDTWFTW